MADLFTIPKRAYDGLRDLIEIDTDKLNQLAGEVADKELTLDAGRLLAELADSIKVDADRLERAVLRVLIPLSGLRADFQMSPDEFLKELDELIQRQNPDWHKQNQTGWAKVAPTVGRLIAPNGYFGHLQKAFLLIANRSSLVEEIKVLSELRPVFDDEATSLKAMLLTSTLVIDYKESGVSKRLHLALDQQNLQALQEQLDRAGKKVQLLEEQVGQLGVPVLVVGAESE